MGPLLQNSSEMLALLCVGLRLWDWIEQRRAGK